MKKEEFIRLGLDEDIAKKCEAASNEELKGFVPKARFDEVSTEKKTLETTLTERNAQLETLKNSTGDVEALKAQITTLQTANQEAETAHAAEIKQLKVDNAVAAAITAIGGKNAVAIKALLKDMDKAELADDGTVKGVTEQLTALKKSDAYLFNEVQKPKVKGAEPGEPGKEEPDGKVDISKMSYEELAAFMTENPDAKI